MGVKNFIQKHWYRSHPGPLWLLYPLELLFLVASWCKKNTTRKSLKPLPVPVLVVGNINVGGTGKTPTLISLINFLQSKGLNPGVVSRGYGRVSDELIFVDESSLSKDAGDEPLLIYESCLCPIAVHKNRRLAAEFLLEQAPECNVVLADDGLQHYRLERDFELALVDGAREFGNRHLLPVGPLREKVTRLKSVDWLLLNVTQAKNLPREFVQSDFFEIQLEMGNLRNLSTGNQCSIDSLNSEITVLAGIANPQGFFSYVNGVLGPCHCESRPDHHAWTESDLLEFSGETIITTTKDAVKMKEVLALNPGIDASAWWRLDVDMVLPDKLKEDIYLALMNWSNA